MQEEGRKGESEVGKEEGNNLQWKPRGERKEKK